MNSKERWLPIEGFPNYTISTFGRVKNIRHGRFLTPSLQKSGGYLRIHLCNKTGCYTKLLHVLVSKAFLGDTPNGLEINHIDGLKTNCRVDNFEFLTPSENIKHAFRIGLRLPTYKKVKHLNSGKVFGSIKEAAETLDVSRSYISLFLHGRAKSVKGNYFELID